MNLINDKLKEDEIVCLDSGDSVVWFGKHFTKECKEVLVSGSWRTMGFGLPAALAAKINHPDQPVTCIIGDGGLEMVLGEILTAVRYKLPIRMIILDNGALAMEKNKMISANLIPEEVELTNPDFVKLVESCGGQGIKTETLEELETSLEETSRTEELVVIDVPTAAPMPAGTKL
jgi:pyruvate dehydrogenase (quinone)/pyruvate oxidase